MAESSGSLVSNNINTQKQSSAVQSADLAEENKTEKAMDAMLLEEFSTDSVPQTLRNLYDYFEKEDIYPDIENTLGGLVYILMLESGFTPRDCIDADSSFNFKRLMLLSKDMSKTLFVLPPFYFYECIFRIISVDNCQKLKVEGKVRGIGTCQVLLNPRCYFSSDDNITIGDLKNLKHLSARVKNEIFYKVKGLILRQNNVVFNCLEHLPPEIIIIIMKKLNVNDLLNFGSTNSFFNRLLKTPEIWRHLLLVDFNKKTSLQTYAELKLCYTLARNDYNMNLAIKDFFALSKGSHLIPYLGFTYYFNNR